MGRLRSAFALAAVLALVACESPQPRPCLVETPREVPLSTRPLATRYVYATPQVEIALTPQTFEETKAVICQGSDFFEGCAQLLALEGNPPLKPRVEHMRRRAIELMLAAALDLGRATVRDRESGELLSLIVAESYEDTCGARHSIGRRYSIPGTSPFLEVRDL